MLPIISVENLGKKYRIGGKPSSHGLRHQLEEVFSKPLQWLKKFNKKQPNLNSSPEEEFWALKDVSFDVEQGDVVGIIGRNGAGKSTLLKILSRITEPTEGRITIRGRVASLLEVGTGFHPELTGRENIYLNGAILGMTRAEIKSKFDEIIAFAEIEKFIDTPVKRYSSGMYVRLAFAVAAHLEPEILVVDEVLAVGDAEFQKKCLGKMEDVSKKEGRTVLFVSLNMDAVQKLCPRAILLKKGQLDAEGEVASVIGNYLRSATEASITREAAFPENNESRHQILKLKILDREKNLAERIVSGVEVTFRFEFECDEDIPNGSVVLYVNSIYGVPLIVACNTPDQGCHHSFKKGNNIFDCVFPSLHLPAGDYLIGGGLAIPNVEWLYLAKDIAKFRVDSGDLFGSGFNITSQRCIIAERYVWEVIDGKNAE